MMRPESILLPPVALLLLLIPAASAAELQPETLAAFDVRVKAAEDRMAGELRPGGAFLFIDGLAEKERDKARHRLQKGEVLIERLADGGSVYVPGGMIHHWVALVFIPSATLERTLEVVQDYDNREEIYRPDVIRSKLLEREGNRFRVFLRFYKKKFTTVVLNTEYDIRFHHLDERRAYANSYSTRIAEVADPDRPDGPEKPAGQDRGYLWRLYTYWRFQETDGGVYLQCEALSLTRGIPFIFRWLLGPLVTSVPRESLQATLDRTRDAILEPRSTARLHPSEPLSQAGAGSARMIRERHQPRMTPIAQSSLSAATRLCRTFGARLFSARSPTASRPWLFHDWPSALPSSVCVILRPEAPGCNRPGREKL